MKTALQLLCEAREKIATARLWTRHFLARDAFGVAIAPEAAGARCWCMRGALEAAARGTTLEITEYKKALNSLRAAIPHAPGEFPDIPGFNDDPDTTHAMVLEVYDTAIRNVTQADTLP